jgi:carbon monoxide dehydrogenase subunit G
MASIRHHAHVNSAPDTVWALVADPTGIADWLPGVDSCTLDGDVRTVGTMGIEVQERVLVSDPELRRFQYGIVGGAMVPELHVATIDVLEDGDGSLVIYSCDVRPDELADMFSSIYASGLEAIKTQAESAA